MSWWPYNIPLQIKTNKNHLLKLLWNKFISNFKSSDHSVQEDKGLSNETSNSLVQLVLIWSDDITNTHCRGAW